MEEAGADDVVAGLFTTGVDAGMGVVRSPIELLVESITELVVGVDAAGVDVELQPTTLATRTAPAMIGRSLRIGGVYEVRATSAGWRGVQGARQVRPADAMPHPPHRCRRTTSSRSQATANRSHQDMQKVPFCEAFGRARCSTRCGLGATGRGRGGAEVEPERRRGDDRPRRAPQLAQVSNSTGQSLHRDRANDYRVAR